MADTAPERPTQQPSTVGVWLTITGRVPRDHGAVFLYLLDMIQQHGLDPAETLVSTQAIWTYENDDIDSGERLEWFDVTINGPKAPARAG